MSETKRPSRREFLKGSTAAVASAALAGGLNVARTAHAQGSDVIKVALIGAGSRGRGAVAQQMNADKNVKLIAVADAFPSKVQDTLNFLKKEHADKVDVPSDHIFSGLDAYKKALATEADLVVLASPPGFRPRHYKAAVEAGKQIFMEKPCCVDAPGYNILMEANKLADEKGLMVGVGLQRRHQPDYMETLAKIHDGAIGKVMFTRVYWNGGSIWNRKRADLAKILGKEPTEMEYQVWNWYHFCWVSGDNICEQHIHNLDVGNWVMGDKHPVEANGMGGCTARYLGENKGTGQIFDHHFVEYVYEDGTRMYSQCRHMRNTFGAIWEAAHGTEGYLGETRRDHRLYRPNGELAWEFDGKKVSGHQQEQTDLVAALRAGKRYNEGWYGANSSMTAVLGRVANYSGKVVEWDKLVEKGSTDFPENLDWDAPAPVQKDDNGDYPIPMPGVFEPYA